MRGGRGSGVEDLAGSGLFAHLVVPGCFPNLTTPNHAIADYPDELIARIAPTILIAAYVFARIVGGNYQGENSDPPRSSKRAWR